MKALVLGGNGFIGSHLVDRLIEEGWDVVVLDRHERRYGDIPSEVQFIQGNLAQPFLLNEALRGVDVVFHLAWSTIHETANQDPAADVKANLIPSLHLIEACQHTGVRRIVFTSSGGTVYGPAQQIPISETHQQNPISAYGITKLAVEKYLQMFMHLYGLDGVILRPSVPYGPRQNPMGRQGAVAVFLYRVANNLPIAIWGDGRVTRDYFYISDLIEALIAAAERDLGRDRIFNVGGGKPISLTQLLELIQEAVEKRAIVQYRAPRPFDAPHIVLDTTLALRDLRWQPRVDLTNGLAQTWAWMASAVPLREPSPTVNL